MCEDSGEENSGARSAQNNRGLNSTQWVYTKTSPASVCGGQNPHQEASTPAHGLGSELHPNTELISLCCLLFVISLRCVLQMSNIKNKATSDLSVGWRWSQHNAARCCLGKRRCVAALSSIRALASHNDDLFFPHKSSFFAAARQSQQPNQSCRRSKHNEVKVQS